MRLLTIALCAVSASACAASQQVSTSMCEAPRTFGGWQGVSVRWKGALLDADHHGMALVALECKATAINLVGLSAEDVATLRSAWSPHSLVFLEVSGKTTHDRNLRVNRVRSMKVAPVSVSERDAFWRSRS